MGEVFGLTFCGGGEKEREQRDREIFLHIEIVKKIGNFKNPSINRTRYTEILFKKML